MAKKEKQPYHIVTFTFPEKSISYQAFSKSKKYQADGVAAELGGTVTRTDEEL